MGSSQLTLPTTPSPAAEPGSIGIAPGRALLLPCACALALAAFALLPFVQRSPNLPWTFLGTAGAILAWSALLYARTRQSGRTLVLQVALRKQHYVQACAQSLILIYWGMYWSGVPAFAPFIVAQLIFAYAFDSLLSWSRRDDYALGFGPFPVILSINLFLWFRLDWFHWQFALVAVGYAAKELIRWTRQGRSVHIFNPSSFPLALASLVLILTGTTNLTLGQEIASSQFNPPHIYAVIFLAALPGQLLFGVASMTLSAVITAYAFALLYFNATGTYLFFDSHIPVAVFLGMHLLFTDPSTSPRSELGRIMFGMLYGLGTIAVFGLLTLAGVPEFYDKLLPVPIMNLLVRVIERVAASDALARLDPARLGRALAPAQRYVAYTSIWAGSFVVLSAAQGVGDEHPGQWLPFWERACQDGRERGCEYLAVMHWNYCDRGSGWACNELGILQAERRIDRRAVLAFSRACSLGFSSGCENVARLTGGAATYARAGPPITDLPIVLRGSKAPVRERSPEALYALGCKRGWTELCTHQAGAGVAR
ncbi:MAG: hypothetical protein ACRELD_07520 [Longimicrobiales bacterium]